MSLPTEDRMHVVERRIATLNKCYCAAPYISVSEPQRTLFLVAAEQDDPCFLYDVDGTAVEKLWDAPGGVMSMVQLPERDGRMVLATQQFYGPDTSVSAKLVVAIAREATPSARAVQECGWSRCVVAEMPFLHRFDILPGRGVGNTARFLLACTLKQNQAGPGDWSQPGQVLAAQLPADFSTLLPDNWREATEETFIKTPLPWQVIKEGCLKNHGYHRHRDPISGEVNCVIGCDAGAFLFRPPTAGGAVWDITQLTTDPASDAVLVDLDGDGAEELLVLSPFHGDTVVVYHTDDTGCYQRVYTHPTKLPFLHAIWAGTLNRRPCVVLGHREGHRDLLLFTYTPTQGYHAQCLAHDCGPANVIKVEYAEAASGCTRECIVGCNRETDTITLYDVTPLST